MLLAVIQFVINIFQMKMRTPALAFLALVGQTSAFAPSFGHHKTSKSASLYMAENPQSSVFLTAESAKACIDAVGGSPLYAYSLPQLEKFSNDCLNFPNAFGLTVRYAMKASPNSSILKFFHSKGIHIDASSGYEVNSEDGRICH
jgi:diaminopimelate decarboxylase